MTQIPDPTAMRILVVDDDTVTVTALERLLADGGYREVLSCGKPVEVASLCRGWRPDLVLLDLDMPRLAGFDVLDDLADLLAEPVNLPVLVLTSDATFGSRRRARAMGARDFVPKPLDHEELLARTENLLRTRQLERRLREQNLILTSAVRTRTAELERAGLEAVALLAGASEYRDDETRQHTQRVGRTSALVATELELSEAAVETIRHAAPLHDIGKIGVRDDILLKPGTLTADERRVMQRHVEIGYQILFAAKSPLLRAAANIARTHHERWDGQGYLLGLSGNDIPLAGRIAAVADVFDALTHARPYDEAWPVGDAVAEIARQAGSQFDPRVVSAFLRLDHGELVEDVPLAGAASDAGDRVRFGDAPPRHEVVRRSLDRV